MMRIPYSIASLLLLGVMLGGCACPRGGEDAWSQSMLYFGMSRPDGSQVDEAAWKRFVDEQITPRFPDGLTWFPARGQYRGSDGELVREPTMVLLIVYPRSPRSATREADARLKAIARAYAEQFDQESVLRTDSAATVSFIGVE